MKQIKRYWLVFMIPGMVLMIVILRTFSEGHFSPDAEKNALEAISGENRISEIENSNVDAFYIVWVGENNLPASPGFSIDLALSDSELVKAENIKLLKKIKRPILIISSDISYSARCLMVLSQKGVKDLKLYVPGEAQEELKYKFRPDTTGVS